MHRPVLVSLTLGAALTLGAFAGITPAGAQSPVEKVPIVAVIGCLAEQPAGTWMLANATEPTPSLANAPSAKQPVTGPTSGKHQFRLIGVSEFDLPAHKGHTVLVKALLVKATPISRLNVTSVTMVSDACPPPPK